MRAYGPRTVVCQGARRPQRPTRPPRGPEPARPAGPPCSPSTAASAAPRTRRWSRKSPSLRGGGRKGDVWGRARAPVAMRAGAPARVPFGRVLARNQKPPPRSTTSRPTARASGRSHLRRGGGDIGCTPHRSRRGTRGRESRRTRSPQPEFRPESCPRAGPACCPRRSARGRRGEGGSHRAAPRPPAGADLLVPLPGEVPIDPVQEARGQKSCAQRA